MAKYLVGQTSSYFPNFVAENEKTLLHDLVNEAIQIYGLNCYYLPRQLSNTVDYLYTEDPRAAYLSAYPVVCYLENFDAFKGDRNFVSKFGIEIRDQIVMSIGRREFDDSVGSFTGLSRPDEGDILYVPLNKRMFKITYSEKYSFIYPMGTLPTWKMTAELVESISQRFETGIIEIDAFTSEFTQDELASVIRNENNLPIVLNVDTSTQVVYWRGGPLVPVTEPLDTRSEISAEANTFISFDETDPFSFSPFN